MNERELLINKFLAGETTIEEEQMLARLIEGEAEYENLHSALVDVCRWPVSAALFFPQNPMADVHWSKKTVHRLP